MIYADVSIWEHWEAEIRKYADASCQNLDVWFLLRICVTEESQLTFRFMLGGVSSPNLGRPIFVLRALTYISRAVDA